jgi:hypothetical protein
MKLGTWILSLVQPLLSRIMIALGMSMVSIVGVTEVLAQLKDQLSSGWGAMPAAIAGMVQLAGGGLGIGMIMGAITTRVLLWQAARATQIIGRNPQ